MDYSINRDLFKQISGKKCVSFGASDEKYVLYAERGEIKFRPFHSANRNTRSRIVDFLGGDSKRMKEHNEAVIQLFTRLEKDVGLLKTEIFPKEKSASYVSEQEVRESGKDLKELHELEARVKLTLENLHQAIELVQTLQSNLAERVEYSKEVKELGTRVQEACKREVDELLKCEEKQGQCLRLIGEQVEHIHQRKKGVKQKWQTTGQKVIEARDKRRSAIRKAIMDQAKSEMSEKQLNRPQQRMEHRHKMAQLARGERKDSLDVFLEESLNLEEFECAAWLIRLGAKIPEGKADVLEKYAVLAPSENEDLDFLALEQGYGYKTANLMMMRRQLKEMQKEVPELELSLPPFCGISDHEMRAYLNREIPELSGLWSRFLAQIPEGDKKAYNRGQAFDLSQEAVLILEKIQTKIERHFSGRSLFYHPAIDALLGAENPNSIIVRSTGREDSKTNPNPGGNDSVPDVPPNRREITKAIGTVLASYFSEKSIRQRIQNDDRSLFELPFTPILIQAFIEEKEQPPVGLVAFSRLYGEDPTITKLDAGIGSIEGVVGALVPTDRSDVDERGVRKIIGEKTLRVVNKLGVIANDPQLAKSSALIESTERSLFKLIRTLSKTHPEALSEADREAGLIPAMEMEILVIPGERPKVYLIQVRPLKEPEVPKEPPSYLETEQPLLRGRMLLQGNSYVRELTSSNEMIIENDIDTALTRFLKTPNRENLKLIAIRKPAALGSHPIVYLRPEGIPVIAISDDQQFSQLRALADQSSPSNPLQICPQRGIIAREGVKKMGRIIYPGELATSVRTFPIKRLPNALRQIRELYKLLGEELKMRDFFNEASLNELFDRMAIAPSIEETKQYLATICFRVNKLVEQHGKSPNDLQVYGDLVACARQILEETYKRTLPYLGKADELTRLRSQAELRALCFQDQLDYVDCFSISTCLRDLKAIGASGSPVSRRMKIFARFSFSSTGRQAIEDFIDRIEKELGVKGLERFYRLAVLQNERNIADVWLNGPVMDLVIKGYSVEACLEQLEWVNQQDQNAWESVDKMRQFVSRWQTRMAQWDDPKGFEKHLGVLERELILLGLTGNYDQRINFKRIYGRASAVAKSALIRQWGEILETFDSSIKALHQSRRYPTLIEHVKAYALMVEAYGRFVGETPAGKFKAQDRLNDLAALGTEDLRREFTVSPSFNVASNITGTAINGDGQADGYGFSLPIRIEDWFTYYHQSMLANLAEKFYDAKPVPKERFPLHILYVLNSFEAAAQVKGITIEGNRVTIAANVILNQHGGEFSATLDLKNSKVKEMTIQAYGANECDRWEKMAAAFTLLSGVELKDGAIPVVKDTGFKVELSNIQNPKTIVALMQLIGRGIGSDRDNWAEQGAQGLIGFLEDPKQQKTSSRDYLKYYDHLSNLSIGIPKKEFFSSGLYANRCLLHRAVILREWDAFLAGAKGSLEALKHFDQSDYKQRKSRWEGDLSLSNEGKKVQNKLGGPDQLIAEIGVGMVEAYRAGCIEVLDLHEELKANPDSAKRFKPLIDAVSIVVKPLEEWLNQVTRDENPTRALGYAVNVLSRSPQYLDQVQKIFESLSFDRLVDIGSLIEPHERSDLLRDILGDQKLMQIFRDLYFGKRGQLVDVLNKTRSYKMRESLVELWYKDQTNVEKAIAEELSFVMNEPARLEQFFDLMRNLGHEYPQLESNLLKKRNENLAPKKVIEVLKEWDFMYTHEYWDRFGNSDITAQIQLFIEWMSYIDKDEEIIKDLLKYISSDMLKCIVNCAEPSVERLVVLKLANLLNAASTRSKGQQILRNNPHLKLKLERLS